MNAQGRNGCTPLHLVLQHDGARRHVLVSHTYGRDVDIVADMLLRAGADARGVDNDGLMAEECMPTVSERLTGRTREFVVRNEKAVSHASQPEEEVEFVDVHCSSQEGSSATPGRTQQDRQHAFRGVFFGSFGAQRVPARGSGVPVPRTRPRLAEALLHLFCAVFGVGRGDGGGLDFVWSLEK